MNSSRFIFNLFVLYYLTMFCYIFYHALTFIYIFDICTFTQLFLSCDAGYIQSILLLNFICNFMIMRRNLKKKNIQP